MTDNGQLTGKTPGARSSPRVHSVREITISYEGRDEQIMVKPPNLSKRGMFINTSRSFPEGAVLNLRFGLVLTNAEIETRCEVRYCQPGVGVGVEFIGLAPEAMKTIEKEIEMSAGAPTHTKLRRRLKRAAARSAGKRRR
ncbi:MAG: PilZ domain-containing protein [Candidatus Acidiferrum sp.]